MNLYEDVLAFTKKIEDALLKEDLSENLTDLIKERGVLFARLLESQHHDNCGDENLTEQIRACEKRCVVLARKMKNKLANEMQAMQSNKRRYVAYSRQMALTY